MSEDAAQYVNDPLAFFDLNDLPSFVDASAEPYDFFAPRPTDDAAYDTARGVNFAIEAMNYSRKYGNSACISFSLCSIVERGRMGPLEAGFVTRLAEAAAAGSMN
jgi:hypothetical protein